MTPRPPAPHWPTPRGGRGLLRAAGEREPDTTAAKLNANLFKDVLGKSSTKTAGGSSRSHNVDLACQRVNGTILLPGETFSYNAGQVGPASQAGGYQKAALLDSGTTQDTWAGGVCQLSSTLYYTTLKANLETVERHKHKYDVGICSSGLDATVYSNSLDFQFKNNTDYPIKIVASLQQEQRQPVLQCHHLWHQYHRRLWRSLLGGGQHYRPQDRL